MLAADRLDLTEALAAPAPVARGHLHLVTQTQYALEDAFVGMGFTVAEGPEAETDWYNFEALNIPPAHPARGMFDTFYLDIGEPETVVLRTHTSPVQIHLMEAAVRDGTLPIHAVIPGRCFRRDTPDARHLAVFHQVEGLVVDRGITFGDLAGVIETFTGAYFGPGHPLPPAAGLLPVHRALGRVRDDLRHLPGRGLPDLLGDRVDRAGGLRHGRPGGVRRRGDRRGRVVRLRLRLRYRPLRPDAPRDLRHAGAHRERRALLEAVLMRAPLSWLRDFAPIEGDPAELSAVLDDLGLVVEGVEMVGEGLDDVVVARVDGIAAIAGADRIRLVTVEAGDGPRRDRLRRLPTSPWATWCPWPRWGRCCPGASPSPGAS